MFPSQGRERESAECKTSLADRLDPPNPTPTDQSLPPPARSRHRLGKRAATRFRAKPHTNCDTQTRALSHSTMRTHRTHAHGTRRRAASSLSSPWGSGGGRPARHTWPSTGSGCASSAALVSAARTSTHTRLGAVPSIGSLKALAASDGRAMGPAARRHARVACAPPPPHAQLFGACRAHLVGGRVAEGEHEAGADEAVAQRGVALPVPRVGPPAARRRPHCAPQPQ